MLWQEAAAVEVTKQEVETLLRKVLEEFPQLQEENAIEGMGFPKRATQVAWFLPPVGRTDPRRGKASWWNHEAAGNLGIFGVNFVMICAFGQP